MAVTQRAVPNFLPRLLKKSGRSYRKGNQGKQGNDQTLPEYIHGKLKRSYTMILLSML